MQERLLIFLSWLPLSLLQFVFDDPASVVAAKVWFLGCWVPFVIVWIITPLHPLAHLLQLIPL